MGSEMCIRDRTTSSNAAQDILDDNITLVVGALCTASTIAANAVLSNASIPHISPASTAPSLSNEINYPDLFRVMTYDGIEGTALASLLNETSNNSIALVYSNSAGPSSIAEVFASKYAESDNVLCDEITYDSYDGSYDESYIASTVINNGCSSLALISESYTCLLYTSPSPRDS